MRIPAILAGASLAVLSVFAFAHKPVTRPAVNRAAASIMMDCPECHGPVPTCPPNTQCIP